MRLLSFFQGVYFNFGLVAGVAGVCAPIFFWIINQKEVQAKVVKLGLPASILVGILLRLLWAIYIYPDDIVELDGYKAYAIEMAVGQPMGAGFFEHPTAIQMPAYSVLLALMFKVCKCTSDVVAVILQVSFYVIAALSLFFVGAHLFNRKSAILAVWMFSVYPGGIVHAGFISSDLAAQAWWTFGVGMFLFARVYRDSHHSIFYSGGAGLLWCLAMLSRATALVYVLTIILLFLIIDTMKQRTLSLCRLYLPCLVVFVAVWSPWILRNYRVFEEFVPLTTAGGTNLYLANNPIENVTRFGYSECKSLDDCSASQNGGSEEDADVSPPPAIDLQSAEAVVAFEHVSQMTFAGRTAREEILKDRVYLQQTLAYIGSNPWRVVAQAPAKLVFLFAIDSSMLGVAFSQRYGVSSWPQDAVAGIVNGYHLFILGVSFSWVAIAWRYLFERPERLLGVGLIASMAVVFTFYIVQTRYHTIAIPILCLYAAVALTRGEFALKRSGSLSEPSHEMR